MKLLVLGGTHHVGRAVVETALRRGDVVTTLNRGLSRPPAPGVEALIADRADPGAVRHALGSRQWDAVIDTWAWAPRAVRDSARLLAGRAGHYGYVSSRGVYAWPGPGGADESAPLVAGDPGSQDGADYAAAKRGGELAAVESFGERAMLARAGMILGPYEDVGRIPWWLRRLQRGGVVLAPGPADAALQYIDAMDLAAWMLSAAERRIGGAFNVAGPAGQVTIGQLLKTALRVTGSDTELVWAPAHVLKRGGVPAGHEVRIALPARSAPNRPPRRRRLRRARGRAHHPSAARHPGVAPARRRPRAASRRTLARPVVRPDPGATRPGDHPEPALTITAGTAGSSPD